MPGGSRCRPSRVLVVTLLLLTFMGDALRDALDPRKADKMTQRAAARRQGPARRLRRQGGGARHRLPHRAGEKLALVGESGSGKTVTALSLLRLVQNAELSRRGATSPGEAGGARRPAGTARARAARHPRHGDRDDLPGADDRAQPAVHRRRPDRRGAASCTRACRAREAQRARGASCWRDTGIPEPERRADAYPAPAVGRPAAARHDRDGAGLPAAPAAGRRADHGARRDAARRRSSTCWPTCSASTAWRCC